MDVPPPQPAAAPEPADPPPRSRLAAWAPAIAVGLGLIALLAAGDHLARGWMERRAEREALREEVLAAWRGLGEASEPGERHGALARLEGLLRETGAEELPRVDADHPGVAEAALEALGRAVARGAIDPARVSEVAERCLAEERQARWEERAAGLRPILEKAYTARTAGDPRILEPVLDALRDRFGLIGAIIEVEPGAPAAGSGGEIEVTATTVEREFRRPEETEGAGSERRQLPEKATITLRIESAGEPTTWEGDHRFEAEVTFPPRITGEAFINGAFERRLGEKVATQIQAKEAARRAP